LTEERLAIPGATEVPVFGVVVEVEEVMGKRIPKTFAGSSQRSRSLRLPYSTEEWLDADAVGDGLTLRRWRPGDRFQAIGMVVAKKLQDIFVNEKIPVTQRWRTPLLVAASGEICWIAGYRIGEKFKITAATRRALWIHIRPQGSLFEKV